MLPAVNSTKSTIMVLTQIQKQELPTIQPLNQDCNKNNKTRTEQQKKSSFSST
jgi:hypothetical protein